MLSHDIFSGKCRGFAFVDMEGHEARAAAAALDGKTFWGNSLNVRDEEPNVAIRPLRLLSYIT